MDEREMDVTTGDGGIVGPAGMTWPAPPTYIPPGGMCWTAPDGSYEWLMPMQPQQKRE